MNGFAETIDTTARAIRRHRGLILPVMATAMIFVVLVPLPPGVVDVLLAANIALAAIVLLTAICVPSPLDFSVFPTVLLGATLFRLVLNVATTRLILTAGAAGADAVSARYAAGHVVWAFSDFVTSSSLAVGVILFVLIAVIQFLVVTRGAARISEVAARFALDAMPGKQMAIDADLAGGLIDQHEARSRRRRIAAEGDLYGAMDGASKFLRGDAIAAVVITLVNLLGGLYVGMVQYGWSLSATADLFTRLTIGDGLVNQVPALIVSASAALVVTRGAARTNLGEEVIRQLVRNPAVLAITAVFLGALALTSLPKLPLLLIGGGCAGLAHLLARRQPRETRPGAATDDRQGGDEMRRILTVDPMRISLGFSLVRLAERDGPGGDLLRRVGALRREVAAELGFVVPPIRIGDDLRLTAHGYEIHIRDAKVASGRLHPGDLLAVPSGGASGELSGREGQDPVNGSRCVWISPELRAEAAAAGWLVLDASEALTRHLGEVIRSHAGELLSRAQASQLLESLSDGAAELVAEVREKLTPARIHRVLQGLLAERVPIRDLETILETLSEVASRTSDVAALIESVRGAMARHLSQTYADQDGKLWCACLDEALESDLGQHTDAAGAALPPELAERVRRSVDGSLGRLRAKRRPAVVLCAPEIRPVVREAILTISPDVAVLGYNEIDSVEVQTLSSGSSSGTD